MAADQDIAKNSLPEQPAAVAAAAPPAQEVTAAPKGTADKNEGEKPKAGGRGKGKKRKAKMPRDVTAPRQPLTGYVRYLNERREPLRAADPSLSFAEVTKKLASEWGRLPAEEKQHYLDAAEQDRERYIKEWSVYKESDAYKVFKQQQQERKEAAEISNKGSGGNSAAVSATGTSGITSPPVKRQKTTAAASNKIHKPDSTETNIDSSIASVVNNSGSVQTGGATVTPLQAAGQTALGNYVATPPTRPKAAITPSSAIPSINPLGSQDIQSKMAGSNGNSAEMNQRETDIPIFTEQFLQHNKLRETELRQLRKANTDYEQQNAILQKHIESMRGAVDRTKADIMTQKARATMFRGHLTALQDRLTRGLANISIPGGIRGPTKQNIEQYMEALRCLAVENKNHASVKQARDYLSRMELPA